MPMSVEKFLLAALVPQRATRKGQYFINQLSRVKPMLSYKLKMIDLDPYYSDRLLPAAIQYTVDNWDLFPYGEVDDFLGVDE